MEEEKNNKKKSIKIVVIIILILLAIALVVAFCFTNKNKNGVEDVQSYEIKETPTPTPMPTESANVRKVKELKEENDEIIGWIKIEDTNIDFPLLQTTDNDYYLNHNYKKEEDRYGSVFLKDVCDMNKTNSNLIFYGHNMGDEEMFNNITYYIDPDFYENHKTIYITTDTEEREYTVIAAFKSRVFYKSETNVFRYYNYIDLEDENEYNEFITNVQKSKKYDTGLTAEYGEQLLTMITCEYSQANGRMVVVAKRTK